MSSSAQIFKMLFTNFFVILFQGIIGSIQDNYNISVPYQREKNDGREQLNC